MINLIKIFKNISSLLPYFTIITLYFLFINIEAKKEQPIFKTNRSENKVENNTDRFKEPEILDLAINEKVIRVAIPVVPFNE